MSQDDNNNAQSLLSLSIAAANANPMLRETKHRRISSVGRSRRRLSDARDAATRPVPTSLQTAAASLAALSLASPTLSHRSVNTAPLSPRKRAVFSCESCSKVYRHPSCLIKHRWEHTPQWREASKFVLSKHQQVQLLEAAAILSHLSPSSASLPQDRSLWPSFLSGGLVPPPATSHPISSSVPLHSYAAASPTTEDDALNLLALRDKERRSEYDAYTRTTGWSLPRSSVRSQSGSRSPSVSQSASDSRSDGEYGDDDLRVGFDEVDDRKRVDQWDGMEMEMEMD